MSILGSLMGHRNLRREAALSHRHWDQGRVSASAHEGGDRTGSPGASSPRGQSPHPQAVPLLRTQAQRASRGSCPTVAPGLLWLKRVIARLPSTPTCNHKGLHGEGRSQGDGEQRQTDATKAQGCRPPALEDASKRPRASEDPALPAPGRQTLNTHSLRNQGFLTPRAITNEQTLSLVTKLGICDSRNKKTSTMALLLTSLLDSVSS